MSEATLVNHSLEASRVEFERLAARSKKQAYNLAYRLAGNREDAEDLVQEAYLRAFRSFERYNRDMPFENWLFRILSNLFIDTLRRRPKQAVLSLDRGSMGDAGEEDYAMEIPDYESNPEDIVMKGVMDENLADALGALPKEFRRAVLLCDIDGLSYEEIAQAMGTSIGTVRSRIHRGRTAMRKRMEAAFGRRRTVASTAV